MSGFQPFVVIAIINAEKGERVDLQIYISL